MKDINYDRENYKLKFTRYDYSWSIDEVENKEESKVLHGSEGFFSIERRDGVKFKDLGIFSLEDIYFFKQINENEFKILFKEPYFGDKIVFAQIKFSKDKSEEIFERRVNNIDDIKEYGDVYLINNNELYNSLTHSKLKIDRIDAFDADNDSFKFVGEKKVKVENEVDLLLFDVNSSDMTTDGVYSTLQNRFIPINEEEFINDVYYNNLETDKEKYEYRFKQTINDEVKYYLYELDKKDNSFIGQVVKKFAKSRM